jgi:DNA ligase-1
MNDFKPMLAADCKGDLSKVKFPLVASPKIDGIRCVIRGGKALTRSLKPVPNKHIRSLLENQLLEGLDGELVNARDPMNFQATTSVVMSHEGEPAFIFYVFDHTTHTSVPFNARLYNARVNVHEAQDAELHFVCNVPHVAINSDEELLAYETECLADGYEGVMLRDPEGLYKRGRSTLKEGGLVKLKRFTDDEAFIVGFEERMHNTNEATTNELGRTKRSSAVAGKVGRGDLGAFLCKTKSGVEFSCGSGLTDAQRAAFWGKRDTLLGQRVKFKHLEHGAVDAPRHPVFIGLRDERDL